MTHKQWEALPSVTRDPQILSGAWVFAGTRIPIASLFENLRDGASIVSRGCCGPIADH